MQEIWIAGVEWDNCLPDEINSKAKAWPDEINSKAKAWFDELKDLER